MTFYCYRGLKGNKEVFQQRFGMLKPSWTEAKAGLFHLFRSGLLKFVVGSPAR